MSHTMRALILVDLQFDFCPGGALPVARGDETVAIANRLLSYFSIVAATQDWHPANHESFAVHHDRRGAALGSRASEDHGGVSQRHRSRDR
jgi:nicotinamidase-related amidase